MIAPGSWLLLPVIEPAVAESVSSNSVVLLRLPVVAAAVDVAVLAAVAVAAGVPAAVGRVGLDLEEAVATLAYVQ